MKRLLLAALAVVVIISAAVLSVQHYHKYQNKQAEKDAQVANLAAQQDQKQRQDYAKKEAELLHKYSAQVTECQKGAAAYAKLTPAVKAQTPAPVCGPTVVQ